MNTIGWKIGQPNGEVFVMALHGTTAITASSREKDYVWQEGNRDESALAIEHLVRQTANLEVAGGSLVGEPVEFDLPFRAIYLIHGTDRGSWIYAPLLHKELFAAFMPPEVTIASLADSWSVKADPAKPGDFWIDHATRTLNRWDGSEWVELAS